MTKKKKRMGKKKQSLRTRWGKKRFLVAGLAFCLAGGLAYRIYSSANAGSTEEIVLSENQTMIIGQVSSIAGNDLVLALAEEVDMDSLRSGAGTEDASEEQTGRQPGAGGTADSEEAAPSAESTETASAADGEMPAAADGAPSGDMSGFGGEMPSGDATGFGGEMPEGMELPEGGNSTGRGGDSEQSRTMYQLTGEEQSLRIPVGTTVTTSLGATTTFARISAEDMLKIVLETTETGEEVVVGVWIVG